ncbi:MAG: hypothetical protein S4CHLAM37_09260 [Chlamydiia bacterium]|nr:hypothetical protein [Chlamydiia bacterium]
MTGNLRPFIGFTLILFFLLDPIGNIPTYLGIKKRFKDEKSDKILTINFLIGLAVIFICFFCADYILEALHISKPVVSICAFFILVWTGGQILFLSKENFQKRRESRINRPPVFPLIVSPPLLIFLLVYYHHDIPREQSALAILIVWVISVLIYKFSSYITRCLGERWMNLLERYIGIVFIMVGCQMALEGIGTFAYHLIQYTS